MPVPEGQTFLEWVRHRTDVFFSLTAGANSRDPSRWKADDHDDNHYTWRPGQPGEQEYDFGDAFPTSGGRVRVDRKEGYLFALYQHRGGTGEFVPYGEEPDD